MLALPVIDKRPFVISSNDSTGKIPSVEIPYIRYLIFKISVKCEMGAVEEAMI